MPPKQLSTEVAELVNLFESAGIGPPRSIEIARNESTSKKLKSIIESGRLQSSPVTAKQGSLLIQLATSNASLDEEARSHISHAVVDGRLQSSDQLSAAIEYFVQGRTYQQAPFDVSCGVNVVVPRDQIVSLTREYCSQRTDDLKSAKWGAFSKTLSGLRALPGLRWASAVEVKNVLDVIFLDIVGPRDDKEALKAKAKAQSKAAKAAQAPSIRADASTSTAPAPNMFETGWLASVFQQGEPKQLVSARAEEHLAVTGGKVYTRFPPEPNGFLHIGHSKAISVNFGFAKQHGGHCYLRYDDTNPEAEEQAYFDSILEIVRWLGFEPFKITYSSDYFDRLYELAVELIRRNKAYMCYCTAEQMQANRGFSIVDGKEVFGSRTACSHRSRPVEESLDAFERMKDGAYLPGEAVLRMKQDLDSPSPQMWDLVAYRTLTAPHHRTGTKWKIYPTYDFTHCLVDSIENITHSLCTLEFILSRESYDWLCDALEVYRPQQYEYGRLNIEGSVMSKRKILKLVREGHVSGWDDPRLYTLPALKRRGVPPGAILSFVNQLGVSNQHSHIGTARFEQAVRAHLEATTPRLMVIMDPLKVTIENLPPDYVKSIERPVHPKVPEMGTTSMPFSRTVYIDRSDFRSIDSADYFRLAPGKSVGLLHVDRPIRCTSFRTDDRTGQVTEVFAKLEDEGFAKPKAYIQWVAEHEPSASPIMIDEVRWFDSLFKSADPASLEDFISDLNPNSLKVVRGAMVEPAFWSTAIEAIRSSRREADSREVVERTGAPEAKKDHIVGNECVRFQGLRVAYLALDSDAVVDLERRTGRIILNVVVNLKEDAGKRSTT